MSTEIWKDIHGYKGLYQVSSMGQVRSLNRVTTAKDGRKMHWRGKVLRFYVHRGYAMACLSKNAIEIRHPVHTLVVRAFLGPLPKGHETHHKNENSTDNRLENLEYILTGKHSSFHHQGERAAHAKLTTQQVKEIKILLAQGYTLKHIANEYGVVFQTISDIKRGLTWKHI